MQKLIFGLVTSITLVSFTACSAGKDTATTKAPIPTAWSDLAAEAAKTDGLNASGTENIIGDWDFNTRLGEPISIYQDHDDQSGADTLYVIGIPLTLSGDSIASEAFKLKLGADGWFSARAATDGAKPQRIQVDLKLDGEKLKGGWFSYEDGTGFGTYSTGTRISPSQARVRRANAKASRSFVRSDQENARRDCLAGTFESPAELVENGRDLCLAKSFKASPGQKTELMRESLDALAENPNLDIFDLLESLGLNQDRAAEARLFNSLLDKLSRSKSQICTPSRFMAGDTLSRVCVDHYSQREALMNTMLSEFTSLPNTLSVEGRHDAFISAVSLPLARYALASYLPEAGTSIYGASPSAAQLFLYDGVWSGIWGPATEKILALINTGKLSIDDPIHGDDGNLSLAERMIASGDPKLVEYAKGFTKIGSERQAELLTTSIRSVRAEIAKADTASRRQMLRMQLRGLLDAARDL
jgi:hypothetical protein